MLIVFEFEFEVAIEARSPQVTMILGGHHQNASAALKSRQTLALVLAPSALGVMLCFEC